MTFLRSTLGLRLRLAAYLLALLGAADQAAAATVFRADAGGSGCAAQSVINNGAPAYASSSQSSCADPWGWGSSSSRATPQGLGASAEWFTVCCGAGTGGTGYAGVQTEFMIIGPPGPVLVSLNLALHGTVGGGTVTGFSERRIGMSVTLGSAWWTGFIDEDAGPGGTVLTTGGNLVIPSGSCATPCSIATAQVGVLANTWVPLAIDLSASVQGASTGYGRAAAFDSLTFPLNADVFTLPDGFTAVIEGMNVVNNRVQVDEEPGGAVPEPSTFALAAGSLAALGFAARRRRRRPSSAPC